MDETRENITWRKLTTEEWERIRPLIPVPQRQGKRKLVTDREMVDLLLYKTHTKTPWSKVPAPESSRMAITKRYSRWREDGTLQRVFEELERMGLLPDEMTKGNTGAEEHTENKTPAWWELTDGQWSRLSGLLPPEQDAARQTERYKTNRQILNALLYREYTGVPWRELPREFGFWRTVYNRYVKWKEDGSFDRVFAEMERMGVLSEEKYLHARHGETPCEQTEDWWELTDEQWQRVALLMPQEEFDKRGRKARSSRSVLNGILCRYHTNVPWRELPEKYGSWRTVFERYRKWYEDGTLRRVFAELEIFWTVLEDEGGSGTNIVALGAPKNLEWWEVTDKQWPRISALLPEEHSPPTGRQKTNRQILDALLYREFTNAPWTALPTEYGSWRSVYNRYTAWKSDGSLQRVFETLERMGFFSDEKYLRGQRADKAECPLDWWEVTDEQWLRILPLLPPEGPDRRGRKRKDNRQMLNAILCRYYTGAGWLELPKKYGPWRTVIERYRLWRDDGTLDRVFLELDKQSVI